MVAVACHKDPRVRRNPREREMLSVAERGRLRLAPQICFTGLPSPLTSYRKRLRCVGVFPPAPPLETRCRIRARSVFSDWGCLPTRSSGVRWSEPEINAEHHFYLYFFLHRLHLMGRASFSPPQHRPRSGPKVRELQPFVPSR